MDAVVVEGAAGVPAGIAPPDQGLGVEVEGLADDVAHPRGVDAHERGLADGPGVEQLLGLHDGRVVEEVLGHPEGRARPGHGRHDPIGLGHAHRDRLLTGDVLAGGERGHDLLGVEIGGGQQLDGVHAGVVEELGVVRVDPGREAPLAGPPLGAGAVGVAEGDDVAARVLEVAGGVELADVAAADDGETHPVHGSLRSMRSAGTFRTVDRQRGRRVGPGHTPCVRSVGNGRARIRG